jgi:polyisoprenoid-binding protein YceI
VTTTPSAIDATYESDDWFDLDKYRQAAGVAYEFSKKKMETEGEQQRESIGKTGSEQRKSSAQEQEFRQSDEARDYGQSQRAYRY